MHSALLLHACILVCASCMWLSKHLYCCKPMYPALPGSGLTPSTNIYANNTPTSNSSFGNNFPQNAASTSYGSQPASSAYGLSSQGSLDNSPWNAAENSTLKVKITDEYRLAAPVPMPPGLAATSSAQQTFDYDFERQVMSNDASASFDAFLAKPEDTYYDNTKASKFTRMGFSPAIVNMALAYHAATRGDDSHIAQFCENYKTLTEDMSFGAQLAAGALIKTKNDLAAAANLITELA